MTALYVADAAEAKQLEVRLFRFYDGAAGYFRVAEAGPGNRFHAALEPLVRELAASRGALSVLEPGAGLTVVPHWLRGMDLNVPLHIAVQDVTATNHDHLNSCADEVLIGPLSGHDTAGRFDLVLSTFVYEHVTDPRGFLDQCMHALRPGGALVIFSPKYVFPFYVPPSLRHLSPKTRQLETLKNAAGVLLSRLTRRARFKVVADPAVFAGTFFRDADAVHLVSPFDARLHLKRRAIARPLRIRRLSVRDWLWQVAALNAQVFRKL